MLSWFGLRGHISIFGVLLNTNIYLRMFFWLSQCCIIINFTFPIVTFKQLRMSILLSSPSVQTFYYSLLRHHTSISFTYVVANDLSFPMRYLSHLYHLYFKHLSIGYSRRRQRFLLLLSGTSISRFVTYSHQSLYNFSFEE